MASVESLEPFFFIAKYTDDSHLSNLRESTNTVILSNNEEKCFVWYHQLVQLIEDGKKSSGNLLENSHYFNLMKVAMQ